MSEPVKQVRKRKSELVVPNCEDKCQANHNIEQTAALLQCSVSHVKRLIEVGRLPFVESGVGVKRKIKRVPHKAIRDMQQIAVPKPNPAQTKRKPEMVEQNRASARR